MPTAPSITKPRSQYASEIDWRRAQVEMLEIWREEALACLIEDSQTINAQQQRIKQLEGALRKTRNSAWDIYYGTSGMLNDPIEEPDTAPPKPKKKARP